MTTDESDGYPYRCGAATELLRMMLQYEGGVIGESVRARAREFLAEEDARTAAHAAETAR